MIQFGDRVMLITGGTAGLGLATARMAHALGARIAVCGRHEDRGRAAAHHVGSGTLFVRADAGVETDVVHMVATVREHFGRLDVLVNNAGVLHRRPVLEENAAGWDEIMTANLRGVFLCCRHALPHLLATRGAIVSVSSSLALATPGGRTPAYDASKAGVLALTRALAVRYGPEGLRANAVCPGFIPTDLNRDVWEGWTSGERDALIGHIPLRRLGTPEDVARAILFLASDAAGWITGCALTVDGGVLAT